MNKEHQWDRPTFGTSQLRRPRIVCLCGSTRFSDSFRKANLEETLKGRIVLTVGCDTKGDDDIFAQMNEEAQMRTKAMLDILHMAKIQQADEILVLDVDGYIGESTQREIYYANYIGKKVRYLSEEEE